MLYMQRRIADDTSSIPDCLVSFIWVYFVFLPLLPTYFNVFPIDFSLFDHHDLKTHIFICITYVTENPPNCHWSKLIVFFLQKMHLLILSIASRQFLLAQAQ